MIVVFNCNIDRCKNVPAEARDNRTQVYVK